MQEYGDGDPMKSKQAPASNEAGSANSGSAHRETSQPNRTETTAEARWRRTAIAAFYRAQARGFAPGGELDDWLEAEREVDALEAGRHETAMSQSAAADGIRPPNDAAAPARERAVSRRTKTTKSTKSAQGAAVQARNREDVS
ncbi:MAG: DUF2934 domain-containing protein [Betaproteobacteria bacterium]|nr:DUF2934 domain-containing protein [Betaproteobacteria bacterium]